MSESPLSRPSRGPLVSWWFGLAAAAAVALVVTIVVTVWEWLENPGGIFRGEAGTNWGFVYDTAISWFVPTFLAVAVVASALHLAWWLLLKR